MMVIKKPQKNFFSQTWKFLWKDESLLSWIVSLIIAFVIVKFVFFPLLSLVFATSMPLVVVESGSMHHPGNFVGNVMGTSNNFKMWWTQAGDWYRLKGLQEADAEIWPLRTGLEIGDIVIVSGKGSIKIGDIIIFNSNQRHPIIHRVVEIRNVNGKKYYETKGDNNAGQLAVETDISEDEIIGKALFRIPKLGWVKLGFVRLFQGFK